MKSWCGPENADFFSSAEVTVSVSSLPPQVSLHFSVFMVMVWASETEDDSRGSSPLCGNQHCYRTQTTDSHYPLASFMAPMSETRWVLRTRDAHSPVYYLKDLVKATQNWKSVSWTQVTWLLVVFTEFNCGNYLSNCPQRFAILKIIIICPFQF